MIFFSNPPACLLDYIVLKEGCYCDENGVQIPTPTPTSGMYIESLSGLTVENLSDIVTEANQNATSLVNQMVYFAATIVSARMNAFLSAAGFDLNKRGYENKLCSVSNVYQTQVAGYKGIRISRAAINSPQSRIFVQQVRLKSKIDGDSTIRIEDVDGNILYSKPVVLYADKEILVQIDLAFEPEIIYILANGANVNLYEYNCNGSAGCCGNAVLHRKEISIMGFDGNQNSSIGYLGVCARLDCTDDNIICNYLGRLKLAILYQTGAEILKEWVSPSSRINFIKTAGQEWAAETILEWEKLSIDYLQAEIINIQNIMKYDRYCFKCENQFKQIAALPS